MSYNVECKCYRCDIERMDGRFTSLFNGMLTNVDSRKRRKKNVHIS